MPPRYTPILHLLPLFIITVLISTAFPPHIHAAVLDRFDSTFIYDDHRDGDAVYDLSLSFSHNSSKEPTPKYIQFIFDVPPYAKIKHVFVKAWNHIRPEILVPNSDHILILPLPLNWHYQNIYIRVDFTTFYRDLPRPLGARTPDWNFVTLLCQDLSNCDLANSNAHNVYTYIETVHYPQFGTPSTQWLTQWHALNDKTIDQNENLFEMVLTDTFTNPASLTTDSQIDFFDVKFVGYYSFATDLPHEGRLIKTHCSLNQIPVDVQLLGTDRRHLRVYLNSTLSSDLVDESARVRQLIVQRKHRLLFKCDDALRLKIDWRSGPYPYSVIRVGYQRVTSSQTYEDILYDDFFFNQLTPFYSQHASLPPPQFVDLQSEWNPALELLTMSWVANFTKSSTIGDSDIFWDTRQYLLPDTNFTISTIIDDTRFDLEKYESIRAAKKNDINVSTSYPSPTGYSGLFIYPDMSFEALYDYGPMFTYTDVYYEATTGNPMATFEFLSQEFHQDKAKDCDELRQAADATPYYRSSPLSPYGNYAGVQYLDDLDPWYPVRFFMVWHLPNIKFCTDYPLWASRIQIDSRRDGRYLDEETQRVFESEITQFHFTSYLNITGTPWYVDESACRGDSAEQSHYIQRLQELSGFDSDGNRVKKSQQTDMDVLADKQQQQQQQQQTRPLFSSLSDIFEATGQVDETQFPMLSKLQKFRTRAQKNDKASADNEKNLEKGDHTTKPSPTPQTPPNSQPPFQSSTSTIDDPYEGHFITTSPRGEYQNSALYQQAVHLLKTHGISDPTSLTVPPPSKSTLLNKYHRQRSQNDHFSPQSADSYFDISPSHASGSVNNANDLDLHDFHHGAQQFFVKSRQKDLFIRDPAGLTTQQLDNFDTAPHQQHTTSQATAYSPISAFSDFYNTLSSNIFSTQQTTSDESDQIEPSDCDRSVRHPTNTMATFLFGEALSWSNYYKSRGSEISITLNKCSGNRYHTLLRTSAPDPEDHPDWVVRPESPLIFDSINLSLPPGRHTFLLNTAKGARLAPPGVRTYNQAFSIQCTVEYSFRQLGSHPIPFKKFSSKTTVIFNTNTNSIKVSEFPLPDDVRTAQFQQIGLLDGVNVDCPTIYWGERSWQSSVIFEEFSPDYDDDDDDDDEAVPPDDDWRPPDDSGYPTPFITPAQSDDPDIDPFKGGCYKHYYEQGKDVTNGTISYAQASGFSTMGGRVCHYYDHSDHTMSTVACGKLFEQLNQATPRFMLSVNRLNPASHLNPKEVRDGLWSGLHPPQHETLYSVIILPILFAVALTIFVLITLWRRYEDHLATRRLKGMQTQTDAMDSVDSETGRTRIQQLLAELHAENGQDDVEKEQKRLQEVQEKERRERERERQDEADDENADVPLDPRLSRYAAIAAAKALVQKQKEKQEQEKAKLGGQNDEEDIDE